MAVLLTQKTRGKKKKFGEISDPFGSLQPFVPPSDSGDRGGQRRIAALKDPATLEWRETMERAGLQIA